MIALHDLARLITAVAPHAASSSDDHPALTRICLETTPTHLIAVATDNYSLGVARHPLTEPVKGAPDAFHIHAEDAAELAKHALYDPMALVRWAGDEDTGPLLDVGGSPLYPASVTWGRKGFVDWRAKVAQLVEQPAVAVDHLALSPRYLARLTEVRTRTWHCDIRVCGGPGTEGVLLVRIDDWFLSMFRVASGGAMPLNAADVAEFARDFAGAPAAAGA